MNHIHVQDFKIRATAKVVPTIQRIGLPSIVGAGLVPALVGLVPALVGLVPALVGLVPALVGLNLCL